ncbi:MAG: O-antigen ligase family protein [Lachnospiraceae bacterium]|nr:O-antigen ligase family protein [Lachnospiraceae bacterium]
MDTVITQKRKSIAAALLFAGIFIMTAAEWNFYSWYTAVTPYGTLFASLILTACFFCCVNVSDALKDPVFYLMAGTDVLALVNLFLVKSHYGAILTIADLLLICYLANKMTVSKKWFPLFAALPAFYFFYWTVDVKGYFKGYNTNYGGLILITGFSCLMILLTHVREECKRRWPERYRVLKWILLILQLFFFALGYNIIAWYRSRCALVGLVTVTILILLPKQVFKSRILYAMVCFFTTFGAVLVSAVYVWLGRMKDVFEIRIFYKDILSGREELWGELWNAYLQKPFTGIGSAYEMQVDFMRGAFEVHNGLLDILFVHGLPVFIIACVFLFVRLLNLRTCVAGDEAGKVIFAAMAAILCTSFFENFVIVPPFSMIFLVLFMLMNCRIEDLTEASGTRRESENLV